MNQQMNQIVTSRMVAWECLRLFSNNFSNNNDQVICAYCFTTKSSKCATCPNCGASLNEDAHNLRPILIDSEDVSQANMVLGVQFKLSYFDQLDSIDRLSFKNLVPAMKALFRLVRQYAGNLPINKSLVFRLLPLIADVDVSRRVINKDSGVSIRLSSVIDLVSYDRWFDASVCCGLMDTDKALGVERPSVYKKLA